MAVKVRQKNIWLVCGEDTALVQSKREELIRRYFKGDPPDPIVFDGTGSFEEYRDSIEGQSLFSAETAVILRNPFFLKKALRKEDEKPYAAFLETLKSAGPEIFAVMTLDGKPDKRTKAVKALLDFASVIECGFMKPQDGAQRMEEYLYDAGKRLAPDARAYLEEALSSWAEISQPFLETECDKIILMCGEAKQVTKTLLEEALTDYMDQGIFGFFERLLDRDAEAVRADAPRVFTSTDAELKNVGFLAAQFRKIKMLKELSRNHASSLEKMSLLGLRGQWQLKGLEASAAKVSEKEAEDFLLALFRYQYRRRLGGDGEELADVLLRFCLRGKPGRCGVPGGKMPV